MANIDTKEVLDKMEYISIQHGSDFVRWSTLINWLKSLEPSAAELPLERERDTCPTCLEDLVPVIHNPKGWVCPECEIGQV